MTTDRAEQYVRTALGISDALDPLMRWDDLMDDLYRAAGKSWELEELDAIDSTVFWAIVWANRQHSTNADRAAMVRAVMADVDMGGDTDSVRRLIESDRQRNRPDSRTYAVPFDDAALALAMTPAEYDRALTVATHGDDVARPFRRMGSVMHSARGLFDVLVLA